MARQAVSQGLINREASKAFQLEGVAEIQARLSRILDATSGKEIKNVYLKGAQILADAARSRAPQGPTGNLKRAIFAGRGDENKPNALAGLNYRIAPHAHLVEYGGTSDPRRTKKGAGRGKMPEGPFFRPAITASKSAIASTIISGFLTILEKHGA
jgi:hypothetical protein